MKLLVDKIFFYTKLWWAFAKNSIIRQLDYKVNLIGRVLTEIVWLLSQIIFFKAIFLQVPQFAGWTEAEIFFFVGTLYLVDGLFMLLSHENQTRMGEMVRNGLLDFYLLRPVSAFFMTGFRYTSVTAFFNLLAGFIVLLYPFVWGGLSLSLSQWLIWAVYSGLGFILLICLVMATCSLAFWTTQTRNLVWLFFELYRLGWRPESVYPQWMRRLLLGFFPAAFLVSIPVQLSLGRIDGLWFVYPWLWTLGAVILVRMLWTRGVARYEGALS